ncbi:MAG: nucleotide exchange factor GrpE [Tepidanaerobacteraceae bacterium]
MTINPGEDIPCKGNDDNNQETKEQECITNNDTEKDTKDERDIQDEQKNLIEEKQKEIDDYKNRWLRAQADFDNYRKRMQKEIQDVHLYAGEDIIKDILPVVDNFERALDSMKDKDDPFYKGIELIYQQLKSVLEKHEIKEIEAVGKPFDPNYHDAVMMVQNEELQDNTVSEVMLKGYMYHSKVIRPSMVQVVKN